MQETWVQSLDQEEPLEKEIAVFPQCSHVVNPTDKGAWQATWGHQSLTQFSD